MFGEGFLQDVHIWKNKVPVQNPLLCEEDGPVYQLRRWYEQFYVDQADIAPEMVDRFEFEVDTTKANEYWQDEVAENLRLKAEEDAGVDDAADEAQSPQIMTAPDRVLMPSFVPTSADTLEDQRLYTSARLVEVGLPGLPGAGRREEEQRAPHLDPVDRRGARRTAPSSTGAPAAGESTPACPRLVASIEQAAREGQVPIGAEDGY